MKDGMTEGGLTLPQCVNLLKAMELSDSEEENECQTREDREDMMTLPEEWVYSEQSMFSGVDSSQEQESLVNVGDKEERRADGTDANTVREEVNDKQKRNGRWGPVVVERRSQRLGKDPRTMMEKAQEAKRKWNEEAPTGKNKHLPVHIIADEFKNVATAIGTIEKDGNPVSDRIAKDLAEKEKNKNIKTGPKCGDASSSVAEKQGK
jgi:hypothetical protein